MADLNDFLAKNDQLRGDPNDSDVSSTHTEAVTLTVLMLRIGETHSLFSHFGKSFIIGNDDVISVTESDAPVPNPLGKGVACSLVVRAEANLSQSDRLRPADLLPTPIYALARPSSIPLSETPNEERSMREQEWLQQRGIDVQSNATCGPTYTDTQSPNSSCETTTNTGTGQLVDDSNVDDRPQDDWGRDDANMDDYSATYYYDKQ